MGLARTGAPASPGSGDFVLCFSTAYRIPRETEKLTVEFVPDRSKTMGSLCRTAAEATEEAVLSALLAAKTMEGRDGCVAPALPPSLIPT